MAEVNEVVAEHIVEGGEQVANVVRAGRDMSLVLYGSLIGTVGGIAVGYFLAKSRLETKYRQIADDEIDEMREHFRRRETAKQEKPEIDDVVEKLGYKQPATDAEDERPPHVEIDVEKVEKRNVFETQPPSEEELGKPLAEEPAIEWDYQTEMKARSDKKPYVIHLDEFKENVTGNEQATYTYYAGDDVLADERDVPIDNMDELIGLENLDKFGHGSEDPSVVYVRNESLSMDMEICRSTGEYAKEVHAMPAEEDPEELRHSNMRRHRPQRSDDDD